jgi:hypothetical protein
MQNPKPLVPGRRAFGLCLLVPRILFLCATLLIFPAIATAQSNYFKAESTKGWQASSIFVQQGQNLSFVASGSWSVDVRNFPYVGPQGYSSDVDRTIFQGCKLDQRVPYGSLLVRIGNDDPSFVVVGNGGTFKAYKGGELQFRIHDADTCLVDNDGLAAGDVTITSPACPISSISIDNSLNNGVVSGTAIASSPCNQAVLEITNNRQYWVNFKLSTVGTVTLSPAGGNLNLFDTFKVLPPGERVRYLATFTRAEQTASVLLDVTTATGENARFMNLAQAGVDLVSLVVPGFGFGVKLGVDLVPDIVNAFGSMPHLSNASHALFQNPPDTGTFINEIINATFAGEFDTLGDELEKLRFAGAKEAFKRLTGNLGQAFGIIDVILRNYGNIFNLLFAYPAGSVTFVSK